MAAAVARAVAATFTSTVAVPRLSPPSSLLLTARLLSSSSSSSFTPLSLSRRTNLSLGFRATPLHSARRLLPIWCLSTRPYNNNTSSGGGGGFTPRSPPGARQGSNFSDRPPTEMAPLFPGCDYMHWLIVMDKPGGEGADKHQMIDCYVKTLAKIVGSEEEAKRKIYNVSCERYFGFGCELDEETANKLEGVPGVLFVLPDSYVDPENKDYGAELYVNGEIVQRSPERQRRVEPPPPNPRDRPRSNDRTRYARRRDNMR